MATRTPKLVRVTTDMADGFGSVSFHYSDGSFGPIHYLPYSTDPSDGYLPKDTVSEITENMAAVARIAAGLF